jgi:nicotinate-nucleotide adenylyltransferase
VIAAIFGGSFNPPHVGHVLAVAYVLATADVDEVIVVPCFHHPFAKDLAGFEHRFAMCERAMGWLPRTRISRMEEELGGDSITLRTVCHFRERYPGTNFRLVIGADVLLEAPRWNEFDRVKDLAPLIVLGRSGVTVPGAPPALLPHVSSTVIRDAIRAGRIAEMSRLIPSDVLGYVRDQGLYRASPAPPGER